MENYVIANISWLCKHQSKHNDDYDFDNDDVNVILTDVGL